MKSAFTWDEENDTSIILAASEEIFDVLLRRVDTCGVMRDRGRESQKTGSSERERKSGLTDDSTSRTHQTKRFSEIIFINEKELFFLKTIVGGRRL